MGRPHDHMSTFSVSLRPRKVLSTQSPQVGHAPSAAATESLNVAASASRFARCVKCPRYPALKGLAVPAVKNTSGPHLTELEIPF